MILRIVLGLVLLSIAAGRSADAKYSVCDQNLAEIKDIQISDCENVHDDCAFVRGFNKTIELKFIPKKKIEQVKVKIAGKLNTLPVPFHISPDEACGHYGFDCPLEPNKPYEFKLTLPILRTYPKIHVDVFLRLMNENGEQISCVEIPARIQEPQKL